MLSKRIRKVAPLFVGAVAAGLGASQSIAALVVDIRATHINGVAIGGANTPKLIVEGFSAGATISMAIWAQVTGSDPTKFQALQSLSGSFLSSNGGLLGNLAAVRQGPWNGSASSNGLSQDLDGDGDLDLGSNNPDNADNFYANRANSLLGPNSTNDDGDTVFGANQPQAIAGGTEYRVGTLRFVVGASGAETQIVFRPRQVGTGATWVENATQVSVPSDNDPDIMVISYSGGDTHSPSSSTFGAGAPVVIGIPEPTTLGVVGLAGLGLFARRRKA